MATLSHKEERTKQWDGGNQLEKEPKTMAESAQSYVAQGEEKAKEAAAYIGAKAEAATESVGHGMESLGGVIRDHTPKEGVLADTGAAVADKLEAGGRYLEARGLQGICDDVTNVIRHNPIPALLVGIGLGFLIARTIRR